MELFFTLLPLAFAFPAFIGAYTYHLHMFQLNSYHYDVEKKWILKNLRGVSALFFPCAFGAALSLIPIPSAASVYIRGGFLTLLFVSVWLTFLYRKMRVKAKKPLVYTDRVKRLTCTAAGVFAAILLGLFLIPRFWGGFEKGGRWASAFGCAVIGLMPLYVMFADLLNKPLENSIRRRLTNEAKRLLLGNRNLKVIGVTGSYGKTSVKYFLTALLSEKYNVLMTPENYNTPMGVVKTIREHLSPLHEIFVCEMGAKRVGEIKELCDLVHPQSGIITSVGPQHLETFGSQERVRKTKFELARALPKDGVIFLNADSDELMKEDYRGKRILYSLENKGDYNGENIRTDVSGTEFTVSHKGEKVRFSTPLIGRHNVLNIVGAIAAAHEEGISFDDLKAPVKRLQSVPHRLQLLDKGSAAVIDDAYNSNPEGAKAALETLALFDGYKILLTPGMVELGEKMEECNENFGKQAANVCDYAVLVGKKQTEPILRGLLEKGFPKEKIFLAKDFSEAIAHAYALPTEGKKPVILLENDLPDNF